MTEATQYQTVTLGGVTLSGVDADGVLWTIAVAAGWFDGAPIRTHREPRAQQPGSWDARGHLGERIISYAGLLFAETARDMEAAARRLHAAIGGGLATLTATSEYGTLSATVRLEVAPSVRPIAGGCASWSLTVAAPDPLLYGPPVYPSPAGLTSTSPGAGRIWPRVWPTDWGVAPGVTPGALSLPNAGTSAYWPRLRIDGPVLNPVVTCVETGAWIRYNGSLLAGQWLDIDCGQRRVLLQGQVSVRRHVSSSGDWLAIPVDGASLAWTADTADPAALLHAWGHERAVY